VVEKRVCKCRIPIHTFIYDVTMGVERAAMDKRWEDAKFDLERSKKALKEVERCLDRKLHRTRRFMKKMEEKLEREELVTLESIGATEEVLGEACEA